MYQKKHENIEDKYNPIFNPGLIAFEKIFDISKRRSRYQKIEIKDDHPTFVIDSKDRKIHKVNFRKNLP